MPSYSITAIPMEKRQRMAEWMCSNYDATVEDFMEEFHIGTAIVTTYMHSAWWYLEKHMEGSAWICRLWKEKERPYEPMYS